MVLPEQASAMVLLARCFPPSLVKEQSPVPKPGPAKQTPSVRKHRPRWRFAPFYQKYEQKSNLSEADTNTLMPRIARDAALRIS